MSKYDQLGNYLKQQPVAIVPMTFEEIERVVGAKLPPSAHRHRPWWSNNPSNSVITKVWLDAGFRTEQVDMEDKKLVFKRVHPASPVSGIAEETSEFEPAQKKLGRHPMIGALKGLLWIEPGYDLTQPALPEWEQLFDEKWADKLG